MAHAYAIVKIKVQCKSNWSDGVTLDQIARQAREDAIRQVQHALSERRDMQMIGEPKVTAVHQDLDKEESS